MIEIKGQILDVYPEGRNSFRACVLGVDEKFSEIIKVVNLDTGKEDRVRKHECEAPIIFNIFGYEA